MGLFDKEHVKQRTDSVHGLVEIPNKPRENVADRFMIAQDSPKPSQEQLDFQSSIRFDTYDLAERINNTIEDSLSH